MSETRSDLMAAMDQMRDIVSLLTGIKQNLIEQGWSGAAAEQIVLHAITAGSK